MKLAFDRSNSVRTKDVDGRLHIAITNISAEEVSDYYGREIPDYESLGLDADTIYGLYRPAEEIIKAISSFNNLPVLLGHAPVSADDHKPDMIIGSTGTDCEFVAPYLRNSMVVWAQDAIDQIESREAADLSCGYRYVPLLESGVFKGKPYQLKMTQLIGNHLAVVPDGRVNGAVIGDSALSLTSISDEKDEPMKTSKPSMAAMLARGALAVAVVPKLATDQKIDIAKLTSGITAKNFSAKLPGILGAIKPKLAQDADFAAIQVAFDAVSEEAKKADAEDEDPDMKPEGAMDEDDEEEKKKKEKEAKAAMDAEEDDDKKEKEAMKEKKEEKAAMDAAIKSQVSMAADAIRKQVMAEARETREAESFARSYVGEIAIACDSADQVYKAALDILKVDVTGVPAVAYKHILAAQPKPGERKHVIAQDSAVVATDRASFAARFPNSRAAH